MIEFVLYLHIFLLSCFSKNYAYLHIDVGGLPLYVSELVLFLGLCATFAKKRTFSTGDKKINFLIYAYLLIGGARLFFSAFFQEQLDQMGMVKVLKDFYIVYSVLWVFVLVGRSKNFWKNSILFAISGSALSQVIGWLGFYFMGIFEDNTTRLLGWPVGNYMINSMYPFALVWFPTPVLAFVSFSYSHLWLSQFILYFKKSWVIGVLIALWFVRKDLKLKKVFIFFFSLFLGIAISWKTIDHVKERKSPVYPHFSYDKKGWENLEKNNPVSFYLMKGLSFSYLYLDQIDPNVNVRFLVMHGEFITEDDYIIENGKKRKLEAHEKSFRFHLWHQAWEGFKDNPFFGNGFGPLVVKTQLNGLPAQVEGKWISGPHNSYLTVLFRIGVLGFLPLLGLLLIVGWKSIFPWRQQNKLFMFYFAGFVITNFMALIAVVLENPHNGFFYWFFISALLSLLPSTNQEVA